MICAHRALEGHHCTHVHSGDKNLFNDEDEDEDFLLSLKAKRNMSSLDLLFSNSKEP